MLVSWLLVCAHTVSLLLARSVSAAFSVFVLAIRAASRASVVSANVSFRSVSDTAADIAAGISCGKSLGKRISHILIHYRYCNTGVPSLVV